MDSPEGTDAPAPDAATPARPAGSGWPGLVARSTLIPLAFGGSGLCVGVLAGLWRGVEAANDSGPVGGGAIGGDLAAWASGLVAFGLYAVGGLVAGLVLGAAVVAGMSLKHRAR